MESQNIQPNPIIPLQTPLNQTLSPTPEKKSRLGKLLSVFLIVGIVAIFAGTGVFAAFTMYRNSQAESPSTTKLANNLNATPTANLSSSGEILEAKAVTNPGWLIYADPEYNYTIEHPTDVVFKEGRFIFTKYASISGGRTGDIPYLKISAVGIGTPKQFIESDLFTSPDTHRKEIASYDDVKINNATGIKFKEPSDRDSYFSYYLTSPSISPIVLDIYFFSSGLAKNTTSQVSIDSYLENIKKTNPSLYDAYKKNLEEQQKTIDEYVKMDGIVKKMLPTLKFLDIKDQAKNWAVKKTSNGISFKYPNSFKIDEYSSGIFEIEDYEYEGKLWKFYIDTRLKGVNSNLDTATKTISSYLKDKTESTISGYKVYKGELNSELAAAYFRDTSPNGINEYRFYAEDFRYPDRKSTRKSTILTVALVPYKGGAIVVYTTDKIIIAAWLDEILSNIKF